MYIALIITHCVEGTKKGHNVTVFFWVLSLSQRNEDVHGMVTIIYHVGQRVSRSLYIRWGQNFDSLTIIYYLEDDS